MNMTSHDTNVKSPPYTSVHKKSNYIFHQNPFRAALTRVKCIFFQPFFHSFTNSSIGWLINYWLVEAVVRDFVRLFYPVLMCLCCFDFPILSLNSDWLAPGMGWRLLGQFPRFCYFPKTSVCQKNVLNIEYHVYTWQVSPQLSCGDTPSDIN